ncbi:MAG: Pectate lyase L [Verrucomicrobiae bacterium]|nr:Pectate lyase L [Verrucomicrobiae bacterium]
MRGHSCRARGTAFGCALVALSALTSGLLHASTYHVSPSGSDANPGTLAQPFATWQKGHDVAMPGDLIYLHGGVYKLKGESSVGVRMRGRNGEPGRPIRFWAYPGQTPVLDCSALRNDRGVTGVSFSADWWHFRGFAVTGVAQPTETSYSTGFRAANCDNCIFEQLEIHHNTAPGFYLSGDASDNLVLNCDFHHNCDALTKDYQGGNADGIAVGFCTGRGNVVRGCRSWWNSDDGYDLWATEQPVTIEDCWAFWNGFKPNTREKAGDGNGFKLGRNANGPRHIIRRNLAFSNRANGFDENGASGPLEITGNTGYANGARNFQFSSAVAHRLRDNLSVRAGERLGPNVEQSRNSWQLAIKVRDESFVSLSDAGVDGPRRPGGGLPRLDFLRLRPGR